MRNNELHLKVRNLGDHESVILRSISTRLDSASPILLQGLQTTQVDQTAVPYDPIQNAQAIHKTALSQVELQHQAEAEKRQATREKSKILWKQLGVHAKAVGSASLKEKKEQRLKQERQKLEQEKAREAWKKEQELLLVERQEQAFLRIQKAHEEQIKRLEPQPQPQIKQQEESIKLAIPKALQKNERVANLIQDLGGLIEATIQQEKQLRDLKPYAGLEGARFGVEAAPLKPELKKQWKSRAEQAMAKLVSVIDRQVPLVSEMIQKSQADYEASLEKIASLDEFRRILDVIFVNYNQLNPKKKIEGSEASMLKQRMLSLYEAHPMLNPQFTKIGASFQKFADHFNATYQQEREELEQKKRNLKLSELNVKLAAELDRGIDQLRKATAEIAADIQEYKGTLHSHMQAVDLFNQAVGSRLDVFNGLMKEVEAEEVQARKVSLDSFLKSRLNQQEIEAHELARGNKGSKDHKKAFQEALSHFHQNIQHAEGKWFQKLSVDEGVKKSWEEVESYRARLVNIDKQAKELKEIWPYKMATEFRIDSAQSLLTYVDAILKKPTIPGPEFQNSFQRLREGTQALLTDLTRDRNRMLLAPLAEVKQLDDKIKLHTMPALQGLHKAVQKLAEHAELIKQMTKLQCKPLSMTELASMSEKEVQDLQGQLKLLAALQKLLVAVPFWNQQVSGVSGPKVGYWNSEKLITIKLHVPDGVGEMANQVMTNETLTVIEKLQEMKKIAAERLENKGLFGSEKPLLRRQATQDFYKLLVKINLAESASLNEMTGQLTTFVTVHQKEIINKASKEKTSATLFSSSLKDAMKPVPTNEATPLLEKGKPKNYGTF